MKIPIITIILATLLCMSSASAQTYYLLQTVTGTGGGLQSSSSGYNMENTIGQPLAGWDFSTGYKEGQGIWQEYNSLQSYFSTCYALGDGWNLISIGELTSDYRTTTIFPSAVSNAFAYLQGYVERDTIYPGNGYWLKFPSAQVVCILGVPLKNDTMSVIAGWNIIGSIGSPVNISAIIQLPPGIVSSSFFGYNGGYQVASVISPPNGYWVRCSGAGKLVMSGNSIQIPLTIASQQESGGTAGLNILTVTPKTKGKNHPAQSLFFASFLPAGKTVESYDMPPPAPGGLDVRFSSNRYAEFFSSESSNEIPLTIHCARVPVTFSWTMKEKDGREYILVEKTGDQVIAQHKLSHNGSITLEDVEKKTFTLQIVSLPVAYALWQNYPNPFNPSTVIQYSIPANGHVTLKVYNMLGQEVATLVDGDQSAGYQSIEWNGTNYASGVYFYKMTAASRSILKTFASVKKMLLIK